MRHTFPVGESVTLEQLDLDPHPDSPSVVRGLVFRKPPALRVLWR
jgi:hypothetical protein